MNVQIGLGWSDDRVETLKRLWKEGYSASQIAAELGGGISRNGVIGKVHRLKLNATPRPRKSGNAGSDASVLAKARKKAVRDKIRIEAKGHGPNGGLGRRIGRAREAGATSLHEVFTKGMQGADRQVERTREIVDDGPRIHLLKLNDHTCKWPEGDPKDADFGFCGAQVDGSVYCAKHHARAYHRAV